jgi:hypothetical protein
MNTSDVQVILNPTPLSLTNARGGRIMRHRNLVEDLPMTALGNVPCNGCRACCLHDMVPLMPERGDLIWTYKHEVIATATGPTAVLPCGEIGECIYLGQDGCTIDIRNTHA